MEREELELRLERGGQMGFSKQTDSDEWLGWILLMKRKPNLSYADRFGPETDPGFIEDVVIPYMKEQYLINIKPYFVLITEWKRDVVESGGYGSPEDIRSEGYRFSSLEEVQTFVQQYGKDLYEIQARGPSFNPP